MAPSITIEVEGSICWVQKDYIPQCFSFDFKAEGKTVEEAKVELLRQIQVELDAGAGLAKDFWQMGEGR